MNWLNSLLVAALTGVLGLFSAGLVAAAYTQWYHVTTREGADGYTIVGLAVLGGIAGGIIGLATARWLAAAGFWKAAGCSLGLVLGVAALVALALYLFADLPPKLDGHELRLEVEIKLPAGQPKPDGEAKFTLASVVNQRQRAAQSGSLQLDQARRENGRWIVPAQAPLFTTRGQRMIRADVAATNLASFMLPLPARPGPSHEQWSEWLPQPRAGEPPWPESKAAYRFRVQRILPPPPEPTEAEAKAEKATEEEKKFAAIPLDSPVQTWFPYVAYEQSQTSRALQLIASRTNLVAELGGLVLSEDPKLAHDALHCLGLLPAPPKELLPAVQAAGRDIAARITKFKHTPKEADPAFETATDASTRFYGWLTAVKALREKCGGDFTPELKSILELSRVRPESQCMRQDICRVASFYLHKWAGIAPLPTDPKP